MYTCLFDGIQDHNTCTHTPRRQSEALLAFGCDAGPGEGGSRFLGVLPESQLFEEMVQMEERLGMQLKRRKLEVADALRRHDKLERKAIINLSCELVTLEEELEEDEVCVFVLFLFVLSFWCLFLCCVCVEFCMLLCLVGLHAWVYWWVSFVCFIVFAHSFVCESVFMNVSQRQ